MGDRNVPPSFFKSVKICVICGLFLPPLSDLRVLCESQSLIREIRGLFRLQTERASLALAGSPVLTIGWYC